MATNAEDHEPTKPGPANPQQPDDQGASGLDAPTPPGGPMRSDAPSGAVTPGGPGTPAQPGEPHEQQHPERPVSEPHEAASSRPSGSGGISDANAESSQGEPSDDSGHH